MNGTDLIALALRSCELRKVFRGVFARNSFAGLGRDVTGAFLVNADDLGSGGSHWLAVFIHQDHDGMRNCTFFDSLGRRGGPGSYHINIPGTKTGGHYRVIYNTNRFQPETSDRCGLYCLYVLHWLCRKVPFNYILNILSTEFLYENEQKVIDFADSLKNGLLLC